MAETIIILHTLNCPNVALLRRRVTDALARLPGPAPQVAVEEVADPETANRRGLRGSPSLLIDGADPFTSPETPPAFECRTYHMENGIEGAPSVDQIVAALAVT